jgi:hypothetical protein
MRLAVLVAQVVLTLRLVGWWLILMLLPLVLRLAVLVAPTPKLQRLARRWPRLRRHPRRRLQRTLRNMAW